MHELADLSPTPLAAEAMARRRWFTAGGLWYYHRRGGRSNPFRRGSDFYRRVDPQLRDLCAALHRCGIATTPSCQGHFHRRSRYRTVWRQLEAETAAIRGEGLIVHDSQTGAPCLFRDPSYALPWERFERFYESADPVSPQGYLGLWLGPRGRGPAERLAESPHRAVAGRIDAVPLPDDGAYVALRVLAGNPDRQADAWRDAAHRLRDELARA